MFGNALYTAAANFTIVPDDTVEMALQINAGALELLVTSLSDSEDWSILIFISRPLSDAQMFAGTKTRLMPAFLFNISGTTNISTGYANIFGFLPAVGQRVVIDFIMFTGNNGQVIARQTEIVTVAAAA
jgi:hypothetical protein